MDMLYHVDRYKRQFFIDISKLCTLLLKSYFYSASASFCCIKIYAEMAEKSEVWCPQLLIKLFFYILYGNMKLLYLLLFKVRNNWGRITLVKYIIELHCSKRQTK